MSKNSYLRIGIVLEISIDSELSFLASNKSDIAIGSIVGVQSGSYWVLYQVVRVKPEYYLTNENVYFLDRVTKGHMGRISDEIGEDKVAIKALCSIIGYYSMEGDSLALVEDMPSKHTPKALQAVYKIPMKECLSVFGLSTQGISVGHAIYPERCPAFVDRINFSKHSLISGMTGSGKTRLATLLATSLAEKGHPVTVIDPHNEYTNLFARPNATYSISRYATTTLRERVYEHNKCSMSLYPLRFSIKTITPRILLQLLHLDVEGYHRNAKDVLRLAWRESKGSITNQIFINAIDRRMHSISNSKDINVLKNIRRIFVEETSKANPTIINDEPAWAQVNGGSISIVSGDHTMDIDTSNYINALLQSYLSLLQSEHVSSKLRGFNRILLIDECHQLFNTDSSESIPIITRLLREARKFNISLILVSQNPSDIPNDVITQIDNSFMFKEQGANTSGPKVDRNCVVRLSSGLVDTWIHVKDCTEYGFAMPKGRENQVPLLDEK